MKICKNQSKYLSLGISLFFFTGMLIVLFTLPPTTKLVDEGVLKDQIDWGLKRQTTHAALSLSALLGLFSILRLKEEILQLIETLVTFLGFISFLSYEYYKLIRSFQSINEFESLLHSIDDSYSFSLDFLQEIFFSNPIIQALLISTVIFLMFRMYIESSSYNLFKNRCELDAFIEWLKTLFKNIHEK